MRKLLLLILTISFLTVSGQNKLSKLTVILLDNQNPNSFLTKDTLIKSRMVNIAMTPIDLCFTCSNFHLPYYAPTDGIYKNSAKDKECDMKIYPANVKCYEYDDKKRVIRMTVNGSGTMSSFIYLYNNKNQITRITDGATIFILRYNANGTLSELKQSDGIITKKLVFIYE